MDEIFLSLPQLRGMIGLRVSFLGRVYTVIEVLEIPPAIVLESTAENAVIQPDAHGYARRHVAETITVPVLAQNRKELHPDFLAIDLL